MVAIRSLNYIDDNVTISSEPSPPVASTLKHHHVLLQCRTLKLELIPFPALLSQLAPGKGRPSFVLKLVKCATGKGTFATFGGKNLIFFSFLSNTNKSFVTTTWSILGL